MTGILDRQLRRLGLDADTAPDVTQWRALLERVRRTYSDFEQDRYTIERSLEITSREMLSLNEDLRRASARQRVAHDRLLAVVSALGDGLSALDLGGRLVLLNVAGEGLVGAPAASLVGAPFLDRFELHVREGAGERNADSVELLARVSEGAAVRGLVGALRTHDGRRLPVECVLNPIVEGCAVVGAVLLFRDVTVQREAEEALRRARVDAEAASRAKGDFLAVMSHEIRTPMNAILGMTGLLLDSALTDEQHDHADTVRRASEALLTILDDVLDFSKVESGHLTLESIDFDLTATLDDVAAIFEETARRSGVELVLWVDPEAPRRVRGDPSRLRQVLVNLVGNALKFTERGEVVVRARRHSDDDGLLRFEVRDTGVGITPATRSALFQPFSQADSSTTRRYGGTGLGLAISRRLAGLMGGSIGVESAPGEGSTFWFTARFGAPEATTSPVTPCLAGRRVLVVDRCASVRALLGEVLRHAGAVVECALDVERATERAAEAEALWDVVLVDRLTCPAGRVQLARALRARAGDAAPRVMLLGGAPSDDDCAEGIRTHLRKPLRAGQIAHRLAGALTREGVATRPSARPSNVIATLDGAAGRRVLVVEDNVVNQKVITRILARLGLDCEVADNGLEALGAVARGAYDVILMDCQMPEMDGYATTRRIRAGERTTRVPIVAMTAHCLDGDRARCLDAGMDDYLPKPVAVGPLVDVLRRWLSLV